MGYLVKITKNEQQPWKFRKSAYCDGSVQATLKTGDYTIEGYEEIICVERKGCASEFYKNICTADAKRFRRELDRMSDFAHAFVILCFPLNELIAYPWKSDLPRGIKFKIGNKGDFYLRQFVQLQIDYPNINFLLCGDSENAQKTVNSIFKRIVENYEKNQ
jgi:hypothetical protein